MGRIKAGKTSAEARGGVVAPAYQEQQLPYRQSYRYNAFNNLTERNNLHWGREEWEGVSNNLSYSYNNNRVINAGWQFDADGRVIVAVEPSEYVTAEFDARGLMTRQGSNGERETNRYYDGNGREVKRGGRDFRTFPNGQTYWVERATTYYIRSSILGNEVISEVNNTGRRIKGYVRAAGTTLAMQTGPIDNPQYQFVYFENYDASQMSYRATKPDGTALTGEGYDGAPAELDPFGGNAGLSTPYIELVPIEPENQYLIPLNFDSPMYVNGQRVTATLDGIEVPISLAFSALGNGSADINFRNTDSFLLAQLGISRTPVYGYRDVSPVDPNVRDAPITVSTVEARYFIGWQYQISWNPPQQTRQDNGLITTEPGRVSTNITPRTLDDGDCRFLLNELFGSQNSVMAGYYQPPTLKDPVTGKPFGEGRVNGEIANPLTGEFTELATHIYGGIDGTMRNVSFYIPANPNGSATTSLPSYKGEDRTRTKTATYISGQRTESGGGISTSNVFQLSNGLVIVANHIGEYDKNYKSGERNRQGSFRVGYIGGPGGDSNTGFFIHTHISFFRDGKRVDPRREFCSGNYRLR